MDVPDVQYRCTVGTLNPEKPEYLVVVVVMRSDLTRLDVGLDYVVASSQTRKKGPPVRYQVQQSKALLLCPSKYCKYLRTAISTIPGAGRSQRA
jgi:hypothetical protein